MFSLFQKFKEGLTKTKDKLVHEIKRIVTRSPKLTAESLEELEAALLASDLGMAMTQQILAAAKKAFESQGRAVLDFLEVAARVGGREPEAFRAVVGDDRWPALEELLLEDALAQIAGEEQGVGAMAANRREQPQLRHA